MSGTGGEIVDSAVAVAGYSLEHSLWTRNEQEGAEPVKKRAELMWMEPTYWYCSASVAVLGGGTD